MSIYCDRCGEVAYDPYELFYNVLCMRCMKECEKNFNIWMERRETL